MTIYEIDSKIQELLDSGVDEETGELITDMDALMDLQMERDRKVENLACAVKNMEAEAKAIRDEEKRLAERRKALEAKAARAEDYLAFVLNGEKFSSARVTVGWRKTTKTEVDDSFTEWAKTNAPDLLRFKEPEPDKTAISAALKAGRKLNGAALTTTVSMTIK